MRHIACTILAMLVLAAAYPGEQAAAQGKAELIHQRGRLWENVANDGWIGSLGAWDYLVSAPLGLFPGFTGFQHPLGNENNAINTFANANMHDFRSGVWIVAKDMLRPGPPPIYAPTPAEYELFTSGLQEGAYGVEQTRAPLEMKQNFIENPGFDPLLPEEMITATWNTSVGVTVTRRSYTWSYPGFRDFIIYDYVFKNTGLIVSTQTQQVVTNPQDFQQTLNGVYFVFHSGISVSTKSQINFHSELTAVQAGAFGWLPGAYHDYYHIRDDGELVFSTNANGGKEPLPDDPYPTKPPDQWRQRFDHEESAGASEPGGFRLAVSVCVADLGRASSECASRCAADRYPQGWKFQRRDTRSRAVHHADREEAGFLSLRHHPGHSGEAGEQRSPVQLLHVLIRAVHACAG